GERRLALRLDLARLAGEIDVRSRRVETLLENLEEAPGHQPSLDALSAVLRERGYEATLVGEWSALASRGSVGRNVLLGGFAQRMELRLDVYAGPGADSTVDCGVRDEVSSTLMGGAMGLAKTSREITGVLDSLEAILNG
ncbi:MAG: hypothetical protein ACO21N_09795, partial [Candidatus Nanopelagicales bacterium]